jgi:FkbM family methyltransferase
MDLEILARKLDDLSAANRRIENRLNELQLSNDFLRRRLTSYVGDGVALTYLEDEQPIYINSHDFGPSANFINGGVYETDNLDVMLSFVRPDTVFLDIGANLGFFSLKVAQRCRYAGQVHAFEPHPELARLLRASSFLNGFSQLEGNEGVLKVYRCGLGEANQDVTFSYPRDHLAGGGLGAHENMIQVSAQIRRLDDMMPSDFTFDLAKIDVEGHELEVLRGMQQVLGRSPHAKLLLEKLGQHRGYEGEMEQLLRVHGLEIYSVGGGAMLTRLAPGELAACDGYVLAARPAEVGEELDRRRFRLYPRHFNLGPHASLGGVKLAATGSQGEILFYGPYWFLKRGAYRVTLNGSVTGQLALTLASRFGYDALNFSLSSESKSLDIVVDRDLHNFECVARVGGDSASVELESIEFRLIG